MELASWLIWIWIFRVPKNKFRSVERISFLSFSLSILECFNWIEMTLAVLYNLFLWNFSFFSGNTILFGLPLSLSVSSVMEEKIFEANRSSNRSSSFVLYHNLKWVLLFFVLYYSIFEWIFQFGRKKFKSFWQKTKLSKFNIRSPKKTGNKSLRTLCVILLFRFFLIIANFDNFFFSLVDTM